MCVVVVLWLAVVAVRVVVIDGLVKKILGRGDVDREPGGDGDSGDDKAAVDETGFDVVVVV